jgi:hypothetical protein
MSQVPAVSCIQVPRLETVEAIQRSRKSGMRRGANPLVGWIGVSELLFGWTGSAALLARFDLISV